MKKIFLIPIVILSILLSGCTVNIGVPIVNTPTTMPTPMPTPTYAPTPASTIVYVYVTPVPVYSPPVGGLILKSKQVGVEVRRTTTPGVVAVKTLSGTDVSLLSKTLSYTIMVNGVLLYPNGYPANNADGSAIGAVLYFQSVPSNADVTVIAHFTDGTDFPAWTGNLD